MRLFEKIAFQIMNDYSKKVNNRLPSHRALSMKYFCSRNTIIRAVKLLEDQDKVVCYRGSGCYLKNRKNEVNISQIYSFDEELKDQGINIENEIISFNTTENYHFFGAKEIEIFRIKKLCDEIILVQMNYLKKELFPKLKQEDIEHKRLYRVLHEKYNFKVEYSYENISLAKLPSKINEILPSPLEKCMQITRFSYVNNELVEVTYSYVVSDYITLTTYNRTNNDDLY